MGTLTTSVFLSFLTEVRSLIKSGNTCLHNPTHTAALSLVCRSKNQRVHCSASDPSSFPSALLSSYSNLSLPHTHTHRVNQHSNLDFLLFLSVETVLFLRLASQSQQDNTQQHLVCVWGMWSQVSVSIKRSDITSSTYSKKYTLNVNSLV